MSGESDQQTGIRERELDYVLLRVDQRFRALEAEKKIHDSEHRSKQRQVTFSVIGLMAGAVFAIGAWVFNSFIVQSAEQAADLIRTVELKQIRAEIDGQKDTIGRELKLASAQLKLDLADNIKADIRQTLFDSLKSNIEDIERDLRFERDFLSLMVSADANGESRESLDRAASILVLLGQKSERRDDLLTRPGFYSIVEGLVDGLYERNLHDRLEDVDEVYGQDIQERPEVFQTFTNYYGRKLLSSSDSPNNWDAQDVLRLQRYADIAKGNNYREVALTFEILVEHRRSRTTFSEKMENLFDEANSLTPEDASFLHLLLLQHSNAYTLSPTPDPEEERIAKYGKEFRDKYNTFLVQHFCNVDIYERLQRRMAHPSRDYMRELFEEESAKRLSDC